MFLSTPPSRVATEVCPLRDEVIVVSIHATLAGGDIEQSAALRATLNVSIHATLAGGDGRLYVWEHRTDWFLSTPPSRVATARP